MTRASSKFSRYSPPISCPTLHHYRPAPADFAITTSHFAFAATAEHFVAVQPWHLVLAVALPTSLHPPDPVLHGGKQSIYMDWRWCAQCGMYQLTFWFFGCFFSITNSIFRCRLIIGCFRFRNGFLKNNQIVSRGIKRQDKVRANAYPFW